MLSVEKNICLKNKTDTKKLAHIISTKLIVGDIFCFYGDVGAGKTTLIQHILKFINKDIIAKSPTFPIINVYNNGAIQIYHIDLYRIKNKSELFELGLDEIFNNTIGQNTCFIEWAEKLENNTPTNTISIYITKKSTERLVNIKLSPEQHKRFFT